MRSAWERAARSPARGFSVLEVFVAVAILLVALMALAQLTAMSTHANTSARTTTSASLLAAQKLEQLRGLAWGFDARDRPVSDATTDLTTSPPSAGTGVGLTPSPASALVMNTAGYCDFLDANGRGLGGAGSAPPGTVFVRRWSVSALPQDADNTLVFQVRVMRVDGAFASMVRRLPEEARLITVKTRTTS